MSRRDITRVVQLRLFDRAIPNASGSNFENVVGPIGKRWTREDRFTYNSCKDSQPDYFERYIRNFEALIRRSYGCKRGDGWRGLFHA